MASNFPVRLNGFGGDGCSVVIGDRKIGRVVGGCIGAGGRRRPQAQVPTHLHQQIRPPPVGLLWAENRSKL